MKKIYFNIIVFLLVLFGNLYFIFSGVAKEGFAVEGETRRIYNALTEDVLNMDGDYQQYGGRVNRGFRLKTNFSKSKNYDEMKIFYTLNKLGFRLLEIEKNNFYLFCNNKKSGVLVAKYPTLDITYGSKLTYCKGIDGISGSSI